MNAEIRVNSPWLKPDACKVTDAGHGFPDVFSEACSFGVTGKLAVGQLSHQDIYRTASVLSDFAIVSSESP